MATEVVVTHEKGVRYLDQKCNECFRLSEAVIKASRVTDKTGKKYKVATRTLEVHLESKHPLKKKVTA